MTIHRLQSTASTMKDAGELASKGCPHGTVVVAEEQTAGIGRHGHSWHSEPGAGLYMSMVLRLTGSSPILTMALGLAVQSAIEEVTDLRWPNDVMLNDRKVAGIIVQAVGDALIAGIGVNVNQTGFPPDLIGIATSLYMETGREHSKDALMQRIAAESLRHVQLRKTDILRHFEARSTWVRGKHVQVEGNIQGITEGLDANGFLRVRTAGALETVYAGGVRAL